MTTPLATITVRQGLLWIGIYLLAHLAIRLLFSNTLQVDDAEQIRHAQHLALGYPIPQPPLYSWLSWGLFQLLGTGLVALTLLKYLLIGLTFWTLWLCTHYLYQQQQNQLLALLSLLLMPSFAWHMHQGFTHTILLGLAITATLHALLRLQLESTRINYLYFGAAIGLGVMAKYSFLLFLIPLLLSALSIQPFRKSLLGSGTILSLTAFLVITLPHLLWLVQHYQEVFPVIDQKLQVRSSSSFITRFESLSRFITSALAFVTPWLPLIVALTFRRFSLFKEQAPTTRLLSRFYLILLISVVALSLFFTMPHFKVRWFHPLMMLFPLWWLAVIEQSEPPSERVWKWVVWSTLTVTILIISIRILQVTAGPEIGYYSRLNRPIIEALESLPKPPSKVLLITKDEFLGAHLLSFYPQSSVTIGNTLYDRGFNSEYLQCWLFHDNDDDFISNQWLGESAVKAYVTEIDEVQYTLELAQITGQECLPMIKTLQPPTIQ